MILLHQAKRMISFFRVVEFTQDLSSRFVCFNVFLGLFCDEVVKIMIEFTNDVSCYLVRLRDPNQLSCIRTSRQPFLIAPIETEDVILLGGDSFV